MEKKVIQQQIVAIAEGTATTYGAAAFIANALVKKELTAPELQEVLYAKYPEGAGMVGKLDARSRVLQAIRVHLSRVTGLPLLDKEGKPVMQADGKTPALVSAKMTVSTKNAKRDDKTLNFAPAAARAAAPLSKGGKGTGGKDVPIPEDVTDGLNIVETKDGKVSLTLMEKGLVAKVRAYCEQATIKQREKLAKALVKVFAESNVWLNVPEVSTMDPKAAGDVEHPMQKVG